MKKVLIAILIIVVAAAAGLGIATVGYTATNEYNSDKLPANTYINGINCSGMPYEEASDKLTEYWNEKSIIITGTLNEELAIYSDYGFTYAIEDQIKTLKKDNILLAAANHYIKTPLSVEMQDAIKADQSVMYEADKYEYTDNMEQQIIDAQKAQEVADKFADFDDVTDKKEGK